MPLALAVILPAYHRASKTIVWAWAIAPRWGHALSYRSEVAASLASIKEGSETKGTDEAKSGIQWGSHPWTENGASPRSLGQGGQGGGLAVNRRSETGLLPVEEDWQVLDQLRRARHFPAFRLGRGVV